MEWAENKMELSVDDVVFQTLNNAQNAYFNIEDFILLNIAVGGQLGGAIPGYFPLILYKLIRSVFLNYRRLLRSVFPI